RWSFARMPRRCRLALPQRAGFQITTSASYSFLWRHLLIELNVILAHHKWYLLLTDLCFWCIRVKIDAVNIIENVGSHLGQILACFVYELDDPFATFFER